MRLNLRLKKVLATTAAATIMATAVPVVTYAADYDNHWAKEAITKWSEKEVLEGYEDGTFKPNNKVTRGELAAIIVRVFGLTDTSAAEKYTDVEATKWYASDIAKVSSAGIMNDYEDGTFKPNQEATREEAAYAIAKAYKVAAKETNVTFKDQAQISDWAEAEIASLVAGGYLNGNPDGTFRPTASLTRAEAVTMVDKITADLVNVAGVYSQDIEGNLVVNTKDVELKDMTITGNLYLAEGIGEGDVKLNNVTVLGDVIVEGGGVSTVHVLGQSKLNNIIVDKAGKNPVCVLLGNLVEVKGTVTLASTAILEGNAVSLSKVVVDGAAEPQLVGTLKIEEVIINKTTELVLVDGVTINTLTIKKDAVNTILRGRGEKSQIKNIIVEANGLELKKGFKYNKDKVVVGKDVTVLPKYPESGGGGGGGSSSSNTDTDKAINVSAIQVKLQGKDTPVKVAITGNKVSAVVDSQNNKVTVNGVTFDKDAVIETITAIEDHGIDTLTVGVTDKYSTELKPGTAYDVEDLQAMVAAHKETAKELLQSVNLTPAERERAEALLDKAFGFVAGYQGSAIKVGDLLEAAKEVRAKVTNEDIKEAQERFADILDILGVDITVGEKELTVEGKLTVKATSKHEIDTIRVNVTYK
ncbi:MAG: S-layer homology domain-containing protein [Candidatus Niameybacter stercoravium]|nr:S-layer homology domain-containing protein [Candidatus Niameybacter stercoravium]